MEIRFEKEYLKELFYKGKCSDKKHRFQSHIIKRYIDRINLLECVSSVEELYRYNSLHYEILKGEKEGISSIRVNNQYRIEFIAFKSEDNVLVSICNITELSNHYD